MTTPIKLHNTLALFGAIALLSLAFARGVSADLHLPAAEILAAECQGFETLASTGGTRLTCTDVAVVPDAVDRPDAVPMDAPTKA